MKESRGESEERRPGDLPELKIKILYDNTINPKFKDKGLKSDWGFSALIEIKDSKIIFDTGARFDILYRNMLMLDVKPEDINFIFISHYHKDHYGGLFGFLRKNNNVTVFIPAGCPKQFKDRIIKEGASVVETTKFSRITKNLATTGPMGLEIKEQSLIAMTSKGAVIITGCSHPGIINIVSSVHVLTDNIRLVLGGFHLFKEDKEKIRELAKDMKKMNVKLVSPVHCSGENAKKIFKEVFKEDYREGGVGFSIEI